MNSINHCVVVKQGDALFSEWKSAATISKESYTVGERKYEVITKERYSPTIWKAFLACLLTIVKPIASLCSDEAYRSFKEYLEGLWSGREVVSFAREYSPEELKVEHCQQRTELAVRAEEQACNDLESAATAVQAAQQLLAGLKHVEAAAAALLQMNREGEAAAELALRAAEHTLQVSAANGHRLEKREEEATRHMQSAELQAVKLAREADKQERETLGHLRALCSGDRVDVVEGIISEAPYANGWGAAAWRWWQGQSVHGLETLIPVLERQVCRAVASGDGDEHSLILDALSALVVLQQDYLSGGKVEQGAQVARVGGAAAFELFKGVAERLRNDCKEPEVDLLVETGKKAYWMLAEFFPSTRELRSQKYSLWSILTPEEWFANAFKRGRVRLGISEGPHAELKQQLESIALFTRSGAQQELRIRGLESSLIGNSQGAGSFESLVYLADKTSLFATLHCKVGSQEQQLWAHIREELLFARARVAPLRDAILTVQSRGLEPKDDHSVRRQIDQIARDYLERFDLFPPERQALGIYIPTGYNAQGEQFVDGHTAPTSVSMIEGRYYLFQHNAGAAALAPPVMDGTELIGNTTVPCGPYSRKEVSVFIKRALLMSQRLFNNVEEAQKSFQGLFAENKRLKPEGIPQRAFQHIRNCAVRGPIEWIIFAWQRLGQEAMADRFMRFNLLRSRAIHEKWPVKPLASTFTAQIIAQSGSGSR